MEDCSRDGGVGSGGFDDGMNGLSKETWKVWCTSREYSPTLRELKLGSHSFVTLVDAPSDLEWANIPRKEFPS